MSLVRLLEALKWSFAEDPEVAVADQEDHVDQGEQMILDLVQSQVVVEKDFAGH